MDIGTKKLLTTYESLGMEPDDYEEDEFLDRLRTMKHALAKQYKVEPTLSQQLADAIAREDYELAARLRDQIGQG